MNKYSRRNVIKMIGLGTTALALPDSKPGKAAKQKM